MSSPNSVRKSKSCRVLETSLGLSMHWLKLTDFVALANNFSRVEIQANDTWAFKMAH